MSASDEAGFRLRLADGFLAEAPQDLELGRWRSCVDNSQLATENAAKVALALIGPVGRTRNPSTLLRRAIADGRFAGSLHAAAERLAECSELLGPDLHASSDHGDEHAGRTPWELFGEEDARNAAAIAGDAVETAHAVARAASTQTSR